MFRRDELEVAAQRKTLLQVIVWGQGPGQGPGPDDVFTRPSESYVISTSRVSRAAPLTAHDVVFWVDH